MTQRSDNMTHTHPVDEWKKQEVATERHEAGNPAEQESPTIYDVNQFHGTLDERHKPTSQRNPGDHSIQDAPDVDTGVSERPPPDSTCGSHVPSPFNASYEVPSRASSNPTSANTLGPGHSWLCYDLTFGGPGNLTMGG